MSDRGLFSGAGRAGLYPESDAGYGRTPDGRELVDEVFGDGVIRVESPPGEQEENPVPAVEGTVLGEGAGKELVWRADRHHPQAEPSVWRKLLVRAGMAKAPPGAAELEDADNERVIRQSTWTRAMAVLVANPKGQSAKTPTSILLGAALADVRGGMVVVTEATEAPGDLADRAEGDPARGLTELLKGAEMVHSAGTLAGYTAPQTSHAAVIGSITGRDELTPEDVVTVRTLLDTYYQLVITDTGNNLQAVTFRTAAQMADAVVIPCVVNLQSLRGLQRSLSVVEHLPGQMLERTVLVVSHDGGPEDVELAATTVETLRKHYPVKAVIEVPFDPAIRRDGELVYGDLHPATRLAFRRIARHVVDALNTAPEAAPTPRSTP